MVSGNRSFDGPVFYCPKIWLDDGMPDKKIDGWKNGQKMLECMRPWDMHASQRPNNRSLRRSMPLRPPAVATYLKIVYQVRKRIGPDYFKRLLTCALVTL